ncbi:MAG: DUF6363 domain-containing protein [Halanaerobiales bacterium]
MEVSRMEKDSAELKALYEQGYREAEGQYKELMEWTNNIRG